MSRFPKIPKPEKKRQQRHQMPARNPQIVRQKQNTFQYSSNRTPDNRPQQPRTQVLDDNTNSKQDTSKRKRWPGESERTIGQKISLVFVGILCLVIAFVAASLGSSPKVVVAHGSTAIRPTSAYADAAASLISDQSIRQFSKLTIDRQKITDQLRQQFPELIDVKVQTPVFSRQAVITMKPAVPQLILATSNGDYLVSSEGQALVKADQVSDSFDKAALPRVIDESQTKIEPGKQALTGEQVAYINEIKHQAHAVGLSVQALELRSGGGELFFRFAELPYYVKFSVYEDARKSYGTFQAAREYAEQKGPKPTEYIDVRVPERAYIK